MKKLYFSSVFLAAGYLFMSTKALLDAYAPGFATADTSESFSIACLMFFVGSTLALLAYKMTPKI